MKTNKNSADKERLSEYKRLQKKLIFPNIAIAIIAIVAFYFQMFTPFLKLDVRVTGDAVTSIVSTAMDNTENVDDDSLLAALTDPDVISSAVKDLDVTISIQLSPIQLMAVGTASDEEVKDELIGLVSEVITDLDIKQKVEEILNSVVPGVASAMIVELVKSSVDGLTDEQIQIIDDCGEDITEALKKLADGDASGAKSMVLDAVEEAMTAAGYSAEDISEISQTVESYFDDIVECSTDADGNFSYLTMLDNIDELMERLGSSESGEESANSVTTAKYSLTADETNTASSETSELTELLNLLDDPEAFAEYLLGEELDAETLAAVRTVTLAMFAAIAVISALWGLLALLALLHIILKNKKVGMWYVKLFGGFIASIFYLLPNVAILVLKYNPAILGELSTTASSMLGLISFGGSGLVVLVCLLALWLVSIFWCHPIKKKIKECRRGL